MKTLNVYILLILCLSFSLGNAQKKKPSSQGNKMANLYHAAIAEIKKTAKYEANFNKSCNPKSKLNDLRARDLFPDKKKLGFSMDSLIKLFTYYGGHNSIYAITKTNNYQDYLKELNGKDIASLDNPKLQRKLYDILKTLKKNDFELETQKFSKKGCAYTVENKFKPTQWTMKQIDKKKNIWKSDYQVAILIKITVNCSCKGKTTKDVKSAIFEYQGAGNFETIFNQSIKSRYNRGYTFNFSYLKKPESKVLLKQAFCCEEGDISYEDPMLENTTKEIAALPNQTIGGFIGAGFQQNFDETTFCIGAEYLHKVTQLGNSPLMIGGSANYQTTSFFEVNTNGLALGPTAQLFTSITPSGSVYLVNGVSAQYAFGSQDAFGFESTFSGFSGLLNTGVHVPINDQLGVSLVIPVLSIQSTTFKPEGGEGTFTESNTGVFLENRNAIKIGLRFGF